MKEFETKEFKPFDLFNNHWGLVTAGTIDHFNTCAVSWGSMGTIWGNPRQGTPIITVYIKPERYTWQFLKANDYFTVSFLPEERRDAITYMGNHSGRDGDKAAAAGLTPRPTAGDKGVTYAEAELTFYCMKLYQQAFETSGMSEDIIEFYEDWGQPHWMFIGQVLAVDDKR